MAYPISLPEVKQHLRIDADNFEEDSYINNIVIPAAVQYVTNLIDPYTEITDASCAAPVKDAMLIASADLFDTDRTSYQLGSIKRSDVILRLVMPYKRIYW